MAKDETAAKIVAPAVAPSPAAANPNAGKFSVRAGGKEGVYAARDEAEAWAMFNDANKTSYSPRLPREIKKL